ncbi:MAG TPA: sugar phosphate isomerase/epimerase family protein, partial [Phycisphaerae bacterium]|nr:sugar phosphate isomerase/epimerase family protein [Phycisphaerae bacterium]
EGVRQRAAQELMDTARAARKFFDAAPPAVRKEIKRVVVNGFTGSSIWPLLYSFPPNFPDQIDNGYKDFAKRFKPILDVFEKEDVYFALEVHPTEIAFDISSAARAVEEIKGHPRFGFNFDPSHLGYQGVDYVAFIRQFRDRIFHTHMKDVYWSSRPTRAGVFGGHLNFGHPDRYWDFRSLGRGCVDFEAIIRALNEINYQGPLSVEWEDGGMDREHGAAEACEFVRKLDFAPSARAFDAAFAED